MRERETRFVDRQLVVEEQVEVDRPRAPPLTGASAAEPALDVEEELEQRTRPEVRLERERAVQVRGLRDGAPGLRLAERGDSDDDHVRRRAEKLDRLPDGRLAVAEIRPEADVRPHAPTVAGPAPGHVTAP